MPPPRPPLSPQELNRQCPLPSGLDWFSLDAYQKTAEEDVPAFLAAAVKTTAATDEEVEQIRAARTQLWDVSPRATSHCQHVYFYHVKSCRHCVCSKLGLARILLHLLVCMYS